MQSLLLRCATLSIYPLTSGLLFTERERLLCLSLSFNPSLGDESTFSLSLSVMQSRALITIHVCICTLIWLSRSLSLSLSRSLISQIELRATVQINRSTQVAKEKWNIFLQVENILLECCRMCLSLLTNALSSFNRLIKRVCERERDARWNAAFCVAENILVSRQVARTRNCNTFIYGNGWSRWTLL